MLITPYVLKKDDQAHICNKAHSTPQKNLSIKSLFQMNQKGEEVVGYIGLKKGW